jgi:cysteine desulfurase
MFRFRKKVYLDNNATTEIDKDVVKVMNSVLINNFGNPSSLYKLSYKSAEILEESREIIAKSINAKPEEIIFTGCATESNNQIIFSAYEHYFPAKTKILSTPIEHPAVLSTLEFLQKKGVEVEFLKVNRYGKVNLEEFRKKIDNSVFLICCMFVNNEIGIIQDIKTLSAIAKENGILFFSDCVQAYSKISVDVCDLGIDYGSISAHKINGPKGVGALYVKSGAPIYPYIHGGHQEKGLRAGTEGLHNIAGFAEAAGKINYKISSSPKIKELRDLLRTGIKDLYPDSIFNTPENDCVSNTLSVTFPNIRNSILMAALDFRGISVSAGSACNTPTNEPSHVLMAIGLTEQHARETIRFSLSHKTTLRDIHYTLSSIKEFLGEKGSSINILTPTEFDESMLFNSETYILDIRFKTDRKSVKSMPNAYEADFWKFAKYFKLLPKDKNIVVVCQGGVNSPVISYYLKKKGFKSIYFILTGILGWKHAHPELYNKYAGENVTQLKV